MIALGCDHGGYDLMQEVIAHLEKRGLEYKNFGTYTKDSCDYPEFAHAVAHSIVNGECEKGILICGTGIGISIAANKIDGVRAALCSDVYSAKMTKQHNNANIICLGGRVTGRELACMIVDAWLGAEFEGGRHARRIAILINLKKKRPISRSFFV